MSKAVMEAGIGTLSKVDQWRSPQAPRTARQKPPNGMPKVHATAPVAAPVASKKQVVFRFSAEPGSTVYLAGTFNNWKPGQLKLEEADEKGVYQAALRLPQGKHEYKFIVNGVWCADPNCSDWVANPVGTLNSVVEV